MQARGQRALHPRLVARVDPDQTARVAALDPDEVVDRTARHRRPTIRMSRDEIARAVAEGGVPTPAPALAPVRTRMARGSGEIELFDPDPDPYPDPAFRLLPFRARRPILAMLLTAGLVAGLILALHHIIAGA
jgi:hypothetical protein